MKDTIHVFIACGSGVATSTFAETKIREICEENNIRISVSHGTLNDIPMKAKVSDVIFTTSNYKGDFDIPCMSILPLISGVREKQTIEKIIALLKTIE